MPLTELQICKFIFFIYCNLVKPAKIVFFKVRLISSLYIQNNIKNKIKMIQSTAAVTA